jgi:hypothetical protein
VLEVVDQLDLGPFCESIGPTGTDDWAGPAGRARHGTHQRNQLAASPPFPHFKVGNLFTCRIRAHAGTQWTTRVELANAIFGYLAILHNRQRRHCGLGLLTPVEFKNTSTVA